MVDEALVKGPAVGKSKPQHLSLRVAKLLCISRIARLTVSAQDKVTDVFDYLHSAPALYFRGINPGNIDTYYLGRCLKSFLVFQKPAKFVKRP